MTQLKRRDLFAGAAAVTLASALAPLGARVAESAAPAAGSASAGWFRYKVGDIEITVISDGVTSTPLPATYVANASKDEVNALLEKQFLPKDKATHSYSPCVVNTGGKLVVIDTGGGPGAFNQSKGNFGQFQNNLKAAGIDPNAVDAVVISHFHGDHIGGLITADNKPFYPNAEVLVPETEWKFWTDEGNTTKVAENLRGNFANTKRVFGALGNKATPYQDGKEVVPGITAISTPGHTPGHTSHMVSSGSNKVFLQADITAGMANLFVTNPDWQLVFDSDKAQGVATRKKFYDMASNDRLLVQGFHFPFPGLFYVEKAGGGYRLIPAPAGAAA